MTRIRILADTMPQALAAARRELGPGMRVVSAQARRSHAGWLLGRVVEAEVIAEVAHGLEEPHAPRTAPRRRAQSTAELRLRVAARLALARAVSAAHMAAASVATEAEDALDQAHQADIHGTQQVLPALVTRLAARLRAQGLADVLVDDVVDQVCQRLDVDADDRAVQREFVEALAGLLPVAASAEPARVRVEGRPHIIAVAGPTGVGKTTTVAKLAADCRVRLGLRVGIVAADAYRVGAVDQLQAYAQILGAPMRAADCASAVRSVLLDLAWCDVVLVDTAGRSHRDTPRIAEISALLAAAQPAETHLVLSGAGSSSSLREAIQAFGVTRPTSVVLSKMDECETPAAMLQAVRDAGCPASWFTTGQDVPDDIERASARGLAERVLHAAAEEEPAA
ncbi:MAG: hypothetical protein U0636_05250 [Phycisphaerales bacterium]